jgi:hypothetical protein
MRSRASTPARVCITSGVVAAAILLVSCGRPPRGGHPYATEGAVDRRESARLLRRHSDRPDPAGLAPPRTCGFAQIRAHQSPPTRTASRHEATLRPLAL